MRVKVNNSDGIFPMPVLMIATYNEDGSVNVMNAAWGSMQARGHVVLKLTETHKTVENIKARGAFTVSIADAAHMVEADYFGIESGNDVPDKFERAGFHALKSEFVNAPLIAELPMALECKLLSYDEESHCMTGQIVNVCADESIVTEDGGIDVARLAPIAYDPVNHYYHVLGDKVGNAFADGEKLK